MGYELVGVLLGLVNVLPTLVHHKLVILRCLGGLLVIDVVLMAKLVNTVVEAV
jgi:hypothetical protein